MAQINDLIKKFLGYLAENRKRNKQTVENYRLYLDRFNRWLVIKRIGNFRNLKEADFVAYAAWLKGIYDPARCVYLKNNSRRCHLIALRMFWKFLTRNRLVSFDYRRIRLPRLSNLGHLSLRKVQLEQLLARPCTTRQDKILQIRDSAILELLYCTGLRISELVHLTTDNIDFKKNIIKIKNRKQQRSLGISNQARYWLEQYRRLRNDHSLFLFIRHDPPSVRFGKHNVRGLSARSVERLLRQYSILVGLKPPVTPRQLRQYYLRRLIQFGRNSDEIKNQLGYLSNNFRQRFGH